MQIDGLVYAVCDQLCILQPRYVCSINPNLLDWDWTDSLLSVQSSIDMFAGSWMHHVVHFGMHARTVPRLRVTETTLSWDNVVMAWGLPAPNVYEELYEGAAHNITWCGSMHTPAHASVHGSAHTRQG